ncbi:GNAT family N-acetyltransferase [Microbacterium sp. NPDC057659]|uniref:GNAT family N-acetyltransferase n=1 Tax=Microbacterium sp. NPDC057659 TaxID=3346198 RepID=UPI00366F2E3E
MGGAGVEVEILTTIGDSDAEDLAALLAQLSRTAVFDRARFDAIVSHDATDLIVARADGRIVGMATFVSLPLPSGLRGHVEDVAVDEAMRGRGIARMLLTRMTLLAEERGLRTLDLTSRPSRETALRLYESVGFVRRETNLMRFVPEGPGPHAG